MTLDSRVASHNIHLPVILKGTLPKGRPCVLEDHFQGAPRMLPPALALNKWGVTVEALSLPSPSSFPLVRAAPTAFLAPIIQQRPRCRSDRVEKHVPSRDPMNGAELDDRSHTGSYHRARPLRLCYRVPDDLPSLEFGRFSSGIVATKRDSAASGTGATPGVEHNWMSPSSWRVRHMDLGSGASAADDQPKEQAQRQHILRF